MRQKFLLGSLLVVVCIITAAAHRPVLSAGAVSFDDDQYLMEDNPLVQKPSLKSAWRILTEVLNPSSAIGYYQPLSVISVMLDYAAGGNVKNLEPFHRTNLILHILNTALIIILLYIIFDKPVPAAMAGLLFGVHPLTVEPVAWISDRKTLLAMFFALWCLIFYVRYAHTNSRGHYIASIVMYMFAMMSKPTSLPLAVALLVTDYWPLQRINAKNIKAAIFEKLPFFALGGIFVVITLISNTRTVNALSPEFSVVTKLSQLPLLICYLINLYLKKIIWPVHLSSVYPLPEPLALSNPNIPGGIIVTAIVVIVLLYSARHTRVFLGGGLFFLVLIFPTLGLVRFSTWVIASDKYVYMPAVGLTMILAWCLGWIWKAAEQKFTSIKAGLIALVLLLSAGEVHAVRRYLVYWRDSVTLYEYMLKLEPNAVEVYNNLGAAYAELGRYQDEIEAYKKAIRIKPDLAVAHYNLGVVYGDLGRWQEAIEAFKQTLRMKPNFAMAHYNLGAVYNIIGDKNAALKECEILKSLNTDLANKLSDLIHK